MTCYVRRSLQIGMLIALLHFFAPQAQAQSTGEPQTVDDNAFSQPLNSVVTIDVLKNDLPAGPWLG